MSDQFPLLLEADTFHTLLVLSLKEEGARGMSKIPIVLTCLVMEHFIEEDKFFVKWEFDPQPDLVQPWVNLGGCRCYRSMLHSLHPLYGHLSITHSALPIPTH